MPDFDLRAMRTRDRYALMTRIIGPRPIALVSSLSVDGIPNIAPFSCFGMGGNNPTSCVVCIGSGPDGAPKDTLRNIEATGEYVINITTYAIRGAMNQSSYPYPPEVNEFEAAGFTPLPSQRVKPPSVSEACISLECERFAIVPHGSGSAASNYVIGEVLFARVSADVLGEDGLPDARKIDLLARLGGDLYARITPEVIFPIPRPEKP